MKADARAGASTDSGVNIRFLRLLRVGVKVRGTLYEIRTDPKATLTIEKLSNVCAKIDWKYGWISFRGEVRLYYQTARLRFRRWRLRLSWRGERTLRRWRFSGNSGGGTILEK